jgi:hypothetical protein
LPGGYFNEIIRVPMTNDEIVDCWIINMDMLQRQCNSDEAKKLDKVLWLWLGLDNPMVLLNGWEYFFENKGVSKQTILNYLNIRLAMYINEMDNRQIQLTWRIYDKIKHGKLTNLPVDVFQLTLRAEYLIRIGRFSEAREMLDAVVSHSSEPTLLQRAYYQLGILDNASMDLLPIPNIINLTKALGYAEETKDNKQIANSYLEIGRVLQWQYPALALSMTWQAQVIAEREKDIYQVVIARLQRARSDIMMLMKYSSDHYNAKPFQDDAENIVNTLQRDNMPSDSLKAFYDSTKAYITGDTEPMYRSLEYFMKHKAYNMVYSTAENLAGKAYIKKDWKELFRLANIQKDAAKEMHDAIRLKRVEDLIKDMRKQNELERKENSIDI